MKNRIAVVLAAFAVSFLVPAVVDACTCVYQGLLCEQRWHDSPSRRVFEATVEAIEPNPAADDRLWGQRTRLVKLVNTRALVGEPVPHVVTGSGGGDDCSVTFEIGRRYLIDTSSPSNAAELPVATSCSLTMPLERAGFVLDFLRSLSHPSPGGWIGGTVELYADQPLMDIFDDVPRQRLVNARIVASGPVTRTTTTDAEGGFRIDALPTGEYRVTLELENSGAIEAPEPHTVVLPHTHACVDASFSLAPNGAVEGVVVDGAGRPIADVPVDLRLAAAKGHERATYLTETTDAAGRYAFSGLLPGRYSVGVSLERGPSARSPFAPVLATAGGSEDVVISPGRPRLMAPLVLRRLEPRIITVRAVHRDGRPAVRFLVEAQAFGERQRPFQGTAEWTDAAGHVSLSVFDGVRYRLAVSSERRRGSGIDVIASDEPVRIVVDP